MMTPKIQELFDEVGAAENLTAQSDLASGPGEVFSNVAQLQQMMRFLNQASVDDDEDKAGDKGEDLEDEDDGEDDDDLDFAQMESLLEGLGPLHPDLQGLGANLKTLEEEKMTMQQQLRDAQSEQKAMVNKLDEMRAMMESLGQAAEKARDIKAEQERQEAKLQKT